MVPKIRRLTGILFSALIFLGVALSALLLPGKTDRRLTAYAAPAMQTAYTPSIVITQPAVSEVITAASLPAYPVLIDVTPDCGSGSGCMPPAGSLQIQLISVTIRNLSTGASLVDTVATTPITQRKTLTYWWTLPLTVNRQFVLTATAVNSQPVAGTSAPVTVTLNTLLTYTLQVSKSGTGSGTVSQTPPPPYRYGDAVTLTAIPNVGSSFSGWSGDASGNALSVTLVMTQNKTVTATFARREYLLEVTTVGSGTVNQTPSPPYHYGDVVTLTAVPAPKWWFVNWNGDLPAGTSAMPQISLLMDNNKRLTATFATTQTLFLPVVLKNYTPPKPLVNGNFNDGLNGWMRSTGQFNGHGSGLPQGVENNAALLGNKSYQNNHIPVGYGYIAQEFTVQKRYLKLKYRVVSKDVVKWPKDNHYYDTLEASFTPPWEITDNLRDARGCADNILNPSGQLTPGSDLIFCAGSPNSKAGTTYNTGWKTLTLDMQAHQNKNVTLYLTLWGREYKSPYYNDHGYYNTWVELDNIETTDTP